MLKWNFSFQPPNLVDDKDFTSDHSRSFKSCHDQVQIRSKLALMTLRQSNFHQKLTLGYLEHHQFGQLDGL